ncbi:glycosyltransferase family 2 protein [Lacticaseibacillus sp. 866-1]|uniref:glycosyltransferase family 2 protein n=1 Tax=Lacticaseibacillus sp. 866-1 TaxID=2799576 RepID=UPI001944E9F2|nr:glycosyltransferase family 2 protein [Lacticaseibacillus sp. 866-1]
MTTVKILMTTYNGGEFISEQIESLQSQTYEKWNLVIHDDGSTDETPSILARFAKSDTRISVEEKLPKHLGAKQGFHELLKHTSADYYFFCDQDDVWLPNKIGLSIAAMQKLTGPGLVYTDLRVVDQNLKTLQASMRVSAHYSKNTNYAHLLVQNCVTGCTVVINDDLKRLVVSQNLKDAAMHDWWYALNASARGQMMLLDEATILYRQHGNNAVGAEVPMWRRALRIDARKESLKRIYDIQIQAESLIAQSVPVKAVDQGATKLVASLLTANRFSVSYQILRHGTLKTGILKNLIFLFLIITRPRNIDSYLKRKTQSVC